MKRKILFLSLLSLLQFLLVHFVLIQGFANSGDEQAFLFQARLFSSGQFYVADPIYDRANPLNKYVAADAMDDAGGRRFSKYDPGWPALLSLGARLRVEWLVAPLLGALTVFLLLSYVSRRIGDEFIGTTWWLVTLCSFFSFSVANFGSHTSAMAFLFGAFFLYDHRLDESPSGHSRWQLLSVGLLLGYCSLIRYLDWIPLMVWIAFDLLRQKKIKGLILVLLGFGLLASCHLFYNKLLTGSALMPPALHDARGNLQARLGVSWRGFRDHRDPTSTSAVCIPTGCLAAALPDTAVPQRETENVPGAFRAQCVHLLCLCLDCCGPRAALLFPLLSVSHPRGG